MSKLFSDFISLLSHMPRFLQIRFAINTVIPIFSMF